MGDPGDFQVNIDSNGTFGAITLNGTTIDNGVPQQQFANGQELSDGGTVTVGPTGAYYTAYISDIVLGYIFQVDVRSFIRGAAEQTTAPNSVLEQYFTFTNLTADAQSLESVAYYRSYLNATSGLEDDTVHKDSSRPIVYSTDGTSAQLAALAADQGSYPSLKWQVGQVGTPDAIYDGSIPTTAGLSNNQGPFGPTASDPVEMAVGIDAGVVDPGGQLTLLYYYLFSTDMSEPPMRFPVPAPGALALVGLGLAVLWRLRARRG